MPFGGFVREVFSGQVYDRDFIFLVTPSGEQLAVHGRQDTEGRGGREERAAKIGATAVELTVRWQNPVLDDASAELSNLTEVTRQKWAVRGGHLVQESAAFDSDGSFRDAKTGEWLFLMGSRVFYAKRSGVPALELKVAAKQPLTVQLSKGKPYVLVRSADGRSLQSGAQTFTRERYE